MGLIHAILGNSEKIKLDASKHLSAFFEKTKGMTPEERGKYLETDTVSLSCCCLCRDGYSLSFCCLSRD
ncbi:hypothetical protein NP493_1159g00020 [Ridgeia piscesae]|uniref:UCH catalytic domain-containing protein n=1 Tax=Ridgeia piscesae TaxID=27915 RepID=A0AAD9NIV3_RIDPI|nr:hypothetical protein NP493_1159g00020 [Ridgeia piscesae]